MLQALIFDMDGVILDNNAYHKQSWLAYSQILGKPLSEDAFASKVYGKTNEEILLELLGNVLSKEEQLAHAEAKEALYREMYAPHFTLATGLTNVLQLAKEAGVKLAIATNAPKSNLDFTIEKGQLDRWVQESVYAHMVEKPKPAPDLYLKAMELLEVQPEACIVFEDSLTGAKAGKAAGAKVIGITTTYSRQELTEIVDYVIDSFEEVDLPLLLSIVGK